MSCCGENEKKSKNEEKWRRVSVNDESAHTVSHIYIIAIGLDITPPSILRV